jgi:hypothetical protein
MDRKLLSKTSEAKTNAIPKFILSESEKAKTSAAFGSLDDMHKPTSNKEATKRSGTAVAGVRPDLFDVDRKSLDIFSLPGKPELQTIVPAGTKSKMSKAKAAKAVIGDDIVESNVPKQHEFNFLPGAMLLDTPARYNVMQATVESSDNNVSNQSSSDLDKITSIMEQIKTGDDAINFFARFGADSPVCYIYCASFISLCLA